MPQVLIKADDLRPDALSPRWKAFLEHCVERKFHACVGVMGSRTQKGDDDQAVDAAREMLAWILAQPTLHLWNHGFTHHGNRKRNISEFLGPSADEQAAAIRRTQDRIEQLAGVRLDAFGAPFNWTDHNTVLALQQFPEIRYAFFTPYVPGKVTLHHELFVTCEPFVGEVKPGAPRQFDLDKALAKSKHFRNLGRSFVVQIHPNRWVEGSIDDFTTFIETLAEEGYTTGTIESFAEADQFAGPDTTARPLPHRDPGSTPRPVSRPTPPAAPMHWTRRVPAPLRRMVPEAIRRRLRGSR